MAGFNPWMLLGAPLALDKLALEPAANAYNMYKGIRDDVRAQQDAEQAKYDLAQFAKDPLYESDYNKYSDPVTAEKYGTYIKGQRDFKLKQQAEPLIMDFAKGYKQATGTGDFTDPASLEVLKKEGVNVPSQQAMQNPYVRQGLAELGTSGQNEADIADIANSTNNGVAPPTNALARFLTRGGEKSTNQVKTLADLAKQNDEVLRVKGRQQWINAGGNSPDVVNEPRLRTVMSSAPYGVTLEELGKMGDITGVVPKYQFETVGTGNGIEQQKLAIDPRTLESKPIGQPWMQPQTTVSNKIIQAAEQKGADTIIGQMPQLQSEAEAAYSGNQRISKMRDLIAKGAAGPQGYAKSKIAPALGMLGFKSEGLSDAQLYQAFSKTLGGSLRAQIVGPGPVSNYEQQLLGQVSAGGTTAEAAAKELLDFYEEQGKRKINTYHTQIDALATMAPKTAAAYKKIGAVAVPKPADYRRSK